MNAAAKMIHQSNFFTGHLKDIRLSKILSLQIFLVTSVLISALAVVYMTNLYRLTFSQLEQSEQRAHQLNLQRGQLLLEQASLATPARVQQLAINKLGMIIPANKQIFILRAK